jgi:hypothetical protein
MTAMLITVTQSDIDAGQRGKCADCPVALAIKRHCLPSVEVSVIIWVCFRLGKKVWSWPLPDEERQRIRDFDSGQKMAPHSFEIELPEWANSSTVNRPEREEREHV